MIKLLSAFKRKSGLDLEAFGAHWRGAHTGLVSKIPDLCGYVQSQTIAGGYRKGEPIFDGVDEMWFDDVETMRRATDSPEYRAMAANGGPFIDSSSAITLVIIKETFQKDDPLSLAGVKLFEFAVRKPGTTAAAFQKHWREIHGPLGAAIVQMRRYVQNNPSLSDYEAGQPPRYDGIAEVWFDSTDAMRQAATTAQYAKVRADEPNFIDQGKLRELITHERRLI